MSVSVVPIVEGRGEVAAVPILLRRVGAAIAPTTWLDVARPILARRPSMVRPEELARLLTLAAGKVQGPGGVLVLLDADDDCPATLGPELRAEAARVRPDLTVAVVVADREYEAWFLAAATSLAGSRSLATGLEPPSDPDAVRDAKGWLQSRRTDGRAYTPTLDQPALTEAMDMDAARSRSRSFDTLWRQVERLVALDT